MRYRAESSTVLQVPAASVFAYLDDHSRLSNHMSRRSWRMGWGKFELQLDEHKGRATGSHIRLEGRVLGLRLRLDEVVIEYLPPTRKTWETVGEPRLLVIGPYRMGFELRSASGKQAQESPVATALKVSIDYALPSAPWGRLLGALFGHWYARWCTTRMVADVNAAFGRAR